ncbi:MAG: hypothetical protein JXA15_05315 [Spirochaetales bacterium]|nr:hypothetical protein [Spirochaetales bacterium]
MKRTIFALLVVALAIAPLSAQIRLDAGITIPRGAGLVSSGSTDLAELGEVLSSWIIPLPEAGLYYQFKAGPVRLAVGARVFTFILVSVLWPNAIAEIDFGPVTLSGQVGGGWFGAFGVIPFTSGSGKVFFPELSVWYRFGESFRAGIGAIGLVLPDITTDTIPFLWYLGAKWSFVFE